MDYIIKMDKLREFQAKNMGCYGNFVCCLQSLRQLSKPEKSFPAWFEFGTW